MHLGMLFLYDYSPTLGLFIGCIINKNCGNCYVQVSNFKSIFLSKFAFEKAGVVNSFQGFPVASLAALNSLMCLSNFNKYIRLFPFTVRSSA